MVIPKDFVKKIAVQRYIITQIQMIKSANSNLVMMKKQFNQKDRTIGRYKDRKLNTKNGSIDYLKYY